MAKSATLDVDADLIKWARESAGLSVPQAAKKIGIRPDRLEEWEDTVGHPTPRQLERLADAVKRPVAAFFLPATPAEPPTPLDFRIGPKGAHTDLSSLVRLTVRRSRRIARIYQELAESEQRVPSPHLTRAESVDVGAARARAALGVGLEEQARWESPKLALEEWRSRIEALGTLVLQFNMRKERVSGFSLDEGVPVIVLNKSEHESRRTFTLFHEWAHLLLGEPGLCAVDEGRVAQPNERVESFCNAFAAEVLAPLAAIREAYFAEQLTRGEVSLETAVARAVSRFSVSRWVVLIRLLSAQVIPRDVFTQTAERWAEEAPPPAPTGGRNYPHRKALQNLGVPFVTRVMSARESGAITDADASDYLGIKLKWFPELDAAMPSR